MKTEHLTEGEINGLVDTAVSSLIGHIALESATSYVVKNINEYWDTDFEDTHELVEFCKENTGEIEQCDACGWWVDYLEAFDMCADCAAIEEEEEDEIF